MIYYNANVYVAIRITKKKKKKDEKLKKIF